VCAAAETKLGKPLALKQSLPVMEVFQYPEGYVGKTVQVKGRITEVCQQMGCWINLVDAVADNRVLRVKVKDGEIVFPKTAAGKSAIVEGKLVKLEMTKDQVIAQMQHEAEESGKKFDPKSVKAGKTIFQIEGTGAILLD
jgi:hypothetical protein